jgi:hypothetical protein
MTSKPTLRTVSLCAVVSLVIGLSDGSTPVAAGPAHEDPLADTTPPAAVDDLIVVSRTDHSVVLEWTAPGDDGWSGQASQYDLRYLVDEPLTEDSWPYSYSSGLHDHPGRSPALESFEIDWLTDNRTFYFGIKARDEANNWSPLSRIAVARTEIASPGTWVPESIMACDSRCARHNGLDIDSSGRIGVSFNEPNNRLETRWERTIYAYQEPSETRWHLIPARGTEWALDFAYSPDGVPSMKSRTYRGMRFDYFVGSSWIGGLIEPGGDQSTGFGDTLAYDPSTGEPSMAYYRLWEGTGEDERHEVVYARRVGGLADGTWEFDVIDQLEPIDHDYLFISLAYHPVEGYPSVAYPVSSHAYPFLAQTTGSAPASELWAGPHVAAAPPVSRTLEIRYSRKVDGAWEEPTNVVHLEDLPFMNYESLDLDYHPTEHYPAIAHKSWDGDGVHFRRLDGDEWILETVLEERGKAVNGVSFAYALDGTPYIGYCYMSQPRVMKMALPEHGEWKTEIVDELPDGCQETSMEIDPTSGDPVLLYGEDPPRIVRRKRIGDAGDTCSEAVPLEIGESVPTDMLSSDDVDWFSFQIDEPFSVARLTLEDTSQRVDFEVYRDCAPVSQRLPIGRARHIGRGAEHEFSADAGPYYVRVWEREADSHAHPLPYALTVEVVSPHDTGTLILTDLPLLAELHGLDDVEVATLRGKLAELASHPSVAGLVVEDVETETSEAVREAYADWRLDQVDAEKANALVLALRDWIWAAAEEMPSLRYILIVGDDRVIPHMRLPIAAEVAFHDGWIDESEYLAVGNLAADSSVGSALADDFALTDDSYGTPGEPVAWGRELASFVPLIAVGRLVERLADVIAQIDGFLAADGVLDLREVLVAGTGPMADTADEVDRILGGEGFEAIRRTRLAGPSGSLDAVRRQLLAQRTDLSVLALHADHFSTGWSGGYPTETLRADEIPDATADQSGSVHVWTGSHAGLSAPGAHPEETDFPQAWSRLGGALIGPTGWSYGQPQVLNYQEALSFEIIRALATRGDSSIGDALVAAKRAYFVNNEPSRLHAKTLSGTTLYGLPMFRVLLPQSGMGANREASARGFEPARTSRGSLHQNGPVAISQSLSFSFDEVAPELIITEHGDYYSFGGPSPYSEAGEPIQPKFAKALGSMDLDGRALEPRGAVLTQARYHDVAAFDPLVVSASTMGGTDTSTYSRAPALDRPGWRPSVPLVSRALFQRSGVPELLPDRNEARLLLYAGQYETCSRTERLYDEISVEQYYSDADDEQPPTIVSVFAVDDGEREEFRVLTDDSSGTSRVLVAHTAGDGTWLSTDLVWSETDGEWVGTIPADAIALVQAVDDSGNVTIADNDGRLYGATNSCTRLYLPSASLTIGGGR